MSVGVGRLTVKKYAEMTDGTLIYYEITGEGVPVILLHGNGNDARFFSKQIPKFAQYYRVFAIDSRGQGKSTNASDYLSFRMMAEDLKELLDQEQLRQVMIVGFSDGANFAMKFAAMYPDRVSKLVLNSGNFRINGEKFWTRIATYFLYFFYSVAGLFSRRVLRRRAVISLMVDDLDITTKDLTKISAPTLVIVGRNDLIKQKHSQEIADLIPHAGFISIPQQGHMLARRNPKIFNQIVLKFLKET